MRHLALLALLLCVCAPAAFQPGMYCFPLKDLGRPYLEAEQLVRINRDLTLRLPLTDAKALAEVSAEKLLNGLRKVQMGNISGAYREEVTRIILKAVGKRPKVERRESIRKALLDNQNKGERFDEWLLHGRILHDAVDRVAWEEQLAKSGGTKHTWVTGVWETPLYYLRHIAQQVSLKDGERLVDIGSGFGSPGLYFGTLHPNSKIIGFDIVHTKVEHANARAKAVGLNNTTFIEADLSARSFTLPDADVYYMYSPVNATVAQKLLKDLRKKAKTKKFRLVVHFDVSMDSGIVLEDQPWLTRKPGGGYDYARVYESVAAD